MRIIDAFPFAGTPVELELLKCRFVELYDVVDDFVIVEADVDHQDHPKPYNFVEHADEFAPWKDKVCYVQASGLPTEEQFPHADNPWAREHAQREWIGKGLEELEAQPDDIIMQSDADEIPRPIIVRNLRLRASQTVSFRQLGHFWAIDWLYPDPPGWSGTVATTVGNLATFGPKPFTNMRNTRNANTMQLPNAGWHFSWLGRAEAAQRKVGSFCHPEVVDQMPMDDLDWYWREGYHVGGGDNKQPVKMIPVDVDFVAEVDARPGERPRVLVATPMKVDASSLLPEQFRPTRTQLDVCLFELAAAYKDYTLHVSPDNMAMSLQACAYVLWLARETKARTAIDFGSGFTSFVLRYAGCETVSVDDSPEWLAWTGRFLERRLLDNGRLTVWDDYEPEEHDLVVYDFGNGEFRDAHFVDAFAAIAPGGIAVLDDAMHTNHQQSMRAASRAFQYDLYGLRDYTLDEYMRFCALIVRP